MTPESTPSPAVKMIPLPGVTDSPAALAGASTVGAAVTELVSFGLIGNTTAQLVVAIAGIVVPLAVLAYDGLVRHAHGRALGPRLAPAQLLPFAEASIGQAENVVSELDPALIEKLKSEVKAELTGPVAQQVITQLANAARAGVGPAAPPAAHEPV